AAQQRAQVVPVRAEETRVHLAVSGKARARAIAAERLRDRRDDADLARAVHIAPPLGDLAAIPGLDRLERELAVDALHDLARGDDVVHAPAVGMAHVHVLDEAHDLAAAPEMAR